MPDRISDDLYIDDAPSVRRLPDDHEFDRVVSVGYFDRLGYERPEASTDDLVFWDGEHDYADFERAVDVVLEALDDGQCVLVHCQAGVSRSAAVCAAVVAVRRDSPVSVALRAVREARPKVDPQPEVLESAERYVLEYFSS